MVPQWLIEKKRDGNALTAEEIDFLIQGYTDESIPDYQMAAFAMAVYLKGMTFEETAHLTEAMMNSGDIVDTRSIDRPKIDKHSTGGIGDKVSLILAPLVAACGVAVPMISGRGLGITGGTLDKLESIPGYRVDIEETEFVQILNECGCSIIGQTARIAPADKKLYALRDVTATVPSIPLIVGSIMSKKLAEGIDGLVMDVKVGEGAFMKTLTDAQDLAYNLVEVGARMGKKMAAVITDMNQPLGATAGNALEVLESVQCLKGEGAEDVMEVTMALCARMLVLADKAESPVQAFEQLRDVLDSGRALETFSRMVELQGGDPSFIENPDKLDTASTIETVTADRPGYLAAVNADKIGRACLLLGAGRTKTTDRVDHAVGIADLEKIGTLLEPGDRICTIHANSASKAEEARTMLQEAFDIQEDPSEPTPIIHDTILPRKR